MADKFHSPFCYHIFSVLDTILKLWKTFYFIPSAVRPGCFIILQQMIQVIPPAITTKMKATTVVVQMILNSAAGVDGIMITARSQG